MSPVPRRPTALSTVAEGCLQVLATRGLGRLISVGGAVGLLHFLDYRSTSDVDAWWHRETTTEQRLEVEKAIEEALAAHGDVKIRRWGDVASIELLQDSKKVFSFQIAERSSQLTPSIRLPWIDVAMDGWEDLIASKMVALVERGAPRDFLDIHSVCQAGLIEPRECWDLWRRKQAIAQMDGTMDRARLAIQSHLTRLERLRPMEQITDGEQRRNAARVRSFFGQEMLDALVD